MLGAGGRCFGLDELAEVRGHRYARHRRLGLGFVEVYPIGDFEAIAHSERVDDRGDGGQVERIAVIGGRPVEHFGPAVVSVVPAHHELDQGPKLASQVRFGHPLGHLADFVEIRPFRGADRLGLSPVGSGRRPGSVLREANSHEAKPKHHTPDPGAFASRWIAVPLGDRVAVRSRLLTTFQRPSPRFPGVNAKVTPVLVVAALTKPPPPLDCVRRRGPHPTASSTSTPSADHRWRAVEESGR